MDEHQNPEEAAKSGQDHLKSVASDLKEAAGAEIENIRRAAGQKADEFRGSAQDKVQELRGAAEKATSQAKNWQTEGEAYVRDNPHQGGLGCFGRRPFVGLSSSKMTHGTGFFARYSSFGTVIAGLHPRFGRLLCSLLRTAAAALRIGVSGDWVTFAGSFSLAQ